MHLSSIKTNSLLHLDTNMSTEWTSGCSDPNVRAPTFQKYLERLGDRSVNWYPPGNDSTIPEDDVQRRNHAFKLRAAMLGISFIGHQNFRSFPARWKQATIDSAPPYPLSEMWSVCEELVGIAEQLHIEGPNPLLMYDLDALEEAAFSRWMTFRNRMHSIIFVLLKSKNAVDCLMEGEQRVRFVASAGNNFQDKSWEKIWLATAPITNDTPSRWVLAEQPRKRSADAAELGEGLDRPAKRARRLAPLGVLALLCFGYCLVSAHFSPR